MARRHRSLGVVGAMVDGTVLPPSLEKYADPDS
eukprot:COSAG01_NODE_15104_length_1374_cov_1.060392_1_plen_33_part_10